MNDFGEIAYIVCTLNPPLAEHSTGDATLTILRRAERQFRETAILAAVDVDQRKLYTFYKKVDIADPEEQKVLLGKFGSVLRRNHCTIKTKAAARLSDLMKPEEARLYRLFITAIISSIKIRPNGESALQPVGRNLYLAEQRSFRLELDDCDVSPIWVLYHVDLQVVSGTQVLVTIVVDKRLAFVRALEAAPDTSREKMPAKEAQAVFLAPVGHIARLVPARTDSDAHRSLAKENHDGSASTEAWKELLPTWLRENTDTVVDSSETAWIEAEILVEDVEPEPSHSADGSDSNSHSRSPPTWRRISWPASLAFFYQCNRNGSVSNPLSPSISDDPMQFVQDWIAASRNSGVPAGKPNNETNQPVGDGDEQLFADDGAFDDPEHFQPFGPPVFPNSQTVYPTPPDAVMTHATPGFSSVDGMTAMTPANFPRGVTDVPLAQDEEMRDFDDMPTTGDMSGLYDEDLFDAMPDDNFDQEGNGDEPNWDFFDRPGADPQAMSRDSSRQDDQMAGQKPSDYPGNGAGTGSSKPDGSHHVIEGTGDVAAGPLESTTAGQSLLEGEDKTDPMMPQLRPGAQVSSPDGHKASPADAVAPRRPSIFGGISEIPSIANHDNRYSADGDFWFDPEPKRPLHTDVAKLAKRIPRPPSSFSDSDSSMNSVFMSSNQNMAADLLSGSQRPWTQYHAESPAVVSHYDEVDRRLAREEVQQLMKILASDAMDVPSTTDFILDAHTHKVPKLPIQQFLQVAQILGDQFSQTSLIAREGARSEADLTWHDRTDRQIDLFGIQVPPLTVAELATVKSDPQTFKAGSITKLRPNQVRAKRAERPLLASASIMAFWDTLNLQPESGPKSVTAFCVHPKSANVREGCISLLQRMTDTYTACSFGIHTVGRLAGTTDNGLIEYAAVENGGNNVRQTCQTLGNALASAANIAGTILLYVVSQNHSPASYLEACTAVHTLFEAFTKARRGHHGVSEIALQVVPGDFVASGDTVVIPTQAAYVKFALEVYNRLPPPDRSGPPGESGSAVILSQPEPSVHLQLSANQISPLSQSGPSLHLAYSVSADGRWIAAAWTDELGKTAHTVPYCRRMIDSDAERPRHEIFQDMWEISHDLMGRYRGLWRLAVTREGRYDAAESAEWMRIHQSSTAAQQRCLLLLLSMDFDATIRVFPPSLLGRATQPGMPNSYGTPGSTPQATMTSPEQMVPATPTPGGTSLMNAPTPPELGFDPNLESDLTLLDPTEECWSVILPYGSNQAATPTELRPALAFGLLLKRHSTKLEDGYSTTEIRLAAMCTESADGSTVPRSDEVLDETIRQYRSLITLGITRGRVEPAKASTPWHLATAARSAWVLEQVM